MAAWHQACHTDDKSIGFVPTMGNLHAGHLSLVDIASKVADKTVVSIYVNPTQFGANEDLDKYPRTEQQDLEQLKTKNVDVVFMPSSDEMYPPNKPVDYVEVPPLAKLFEGVARPEHFRGVATVVKKLFGCVQPDHAIFGEKDFQQLLIVKNMVVQQGIKVQIHAGAIVREADGLAMSSRNQYLSPEHRKIAPLLYQSLLVAGDKILSGSSDIADIEQQAIEYIKENGFEPDYFAVRDATTLAEPGKTNRVILLAAKLGNTRLLDNLRLD